MGNVTWKRFTGAEGQTRCPGFGSAKSPCKNYAYDTGFCAHHGHKAERHRRATRYASEQAELARLRAENATLQARAERAEAKVERIENVINIGCGMPGKSKQAALLDVISALDGSAILDGKEGA